MKFYKYVRIFSLQVAQKLAMHINLRLKSKNCMKINLASKFYSARQIYIKLADLSYLCR